MLVQYYYPLSLSAKRLDRYLASGWFRNAVLLYRSQLICLQDDFFSVINIRLPLADYEPKKRLRKIHRRNSNLFTHIIRPAKITKEKEDLYLKHKARFEGFVYSSLNQFLYGEYGYHDVFDTHEICIYDNDKLIAFSFFDKGSKTMASLLGIFDPQYSKYSLGIYTMILEVLYGKNNGCTHYYPGYILDKPSIFDYKLRLGDMEYYHGRGRWSKIDGSQQKNLIGDLLRYKIEEIEEALTANSIDFQRYLYPLFSVGYFEYEFVKSAVYLSCYTEPRTQIQIIIEYDLESREYILSRVSRQTVSYERKDVHISENFLASDNHCLDLLMYQELLETSPSLDSIIHQLKRFV